VNAGKWRLGLWMKSCVVLEVQSCSSHPLGHQEPTKLSTAVWFGAAPAAMQE